VTVESPDTADAPSGADTTGSFRYGVVFILTLALVVFTIAAPAADWSRAVALVIEGAALIVAVATAREQKETTRRREAIGVLVVMVLVVLGIAVGDIPKYVSAGVIALATAAIPIVISRGTVRLMSRRGVTIQAVAGALAIYLSIGLLFAWTIAFIAQVDTSTYYFAQHTSGDSSIWVYYSFTVLTTTGFGDYSSATPVGHALAVIEELTGQLYLVTVIGLLIGNFVGSQQSRRRRDQAD
jgi:hypothetical protein